MARTTRDYAMEYERLAEKDDRNGRPAHAKVAREGAERMHKLADKLGEPR